MRCSLLIRFGRVSDLFGPKDRREAGALQGFLFDGPDRAPDNGGYSVKAAARESARKEILREHRSEARGGLLGLRATPTDSVVVEVGHRGALAL